MRWSIGWLVGIGTKLPEAKVRPRNGGRPGSWPMTVPIAENGKIVEENDAKAFYENPKTERAQDFLKKVMH